MRFNLLLIMMILSSWQIAAQQQVRTYIVNYKGEDIGTIKLQETINGDSVRYKMTSDIKTKFIFTIHVQSSEESMFRNGRLVYSVVNRTINGNERVKRQTLAGADTYTLFNDGKSSVMKNTGIGYNLMQMYCIEPVNILRVYSDNYQQFLPVTRIKPHTYKVLLPDGNYNNYAYTNGVCTTVEVFNSLYKMEMRLR